MKPIGLVLLMTFVVVTGPPAMAQTVSVDASEAIREVHMSDLITSGDDMQQQRFRYMMQNPGSFGNGGAAANSGPPPLSRGDMAALSQKVGTLGALEPDPAGSKTLAKEFAGRYGHDSATRAKYERLFASLIESWHRSARQVGQGGAHGTHLAGAYLYLFEIAYSASNPSSAATLTGENVRSIVSDVANVSAAQQLQLGHALDNREKQRTYDTLGMVGVAMELSREKAVSRHDAVLAEKVRTQGNAVLSHLFGVSGDASRASVLAALNAAGVRVSMPLVARYREVLALH